MRLALALLALVAHTIAHTDSAALAKRRSQVRLPQRVRSACKALGEYKVRLAKPLGIAFEENEVDKPLGVRVAQIVPGGNADLNGRICVGDELVATSAVIFTDKYNQGSFSNWERQMIACTRMDFDSIMAAIGSNDGRYGCVDVVLQLRPTEQTVPRPIGTSRAANPAEDVEWDAFRGVRSAKGASMPIRPPKDAF